MTTPLGTLDVQARDARRVTVARRTRETDITISLGLDGTGAASIATGIGFYDHLLGSLAHHGLFDLEIRATGDLEVDEHHTVEDVALVLGAAFAEALGDRAGIRRFGDSSVPMDESVATAVIDVGGRPYAVIDLPFRAERAGQLPLQLVDHALESFARTAGATLHLRGTGRNDHHLAEAAFKALGRALRVACEPDPRRARRRIDEGLAGMTSSPAPGPLVVVVDYGAGNLVSIDQALRTAGARVRLATTGDEIDGADLLVVPGVGAAAPAMERLRAGGFVGPIEDWVAADLPFLGICLGLQLLFEGSDEDGAETLGVLPGRTVRLDDAPTLPHIGWNQVVRRRAHPAFAGISPDADFYFVHSYVGVPAPGAGDAVLAETEHGSPFVSAVARGNLLGVQFHPERSGTDGLRLIANVVASAA